jgi:hypothetical protein
VRWLRDGQNGSLNSVACSGLTGARIGGEEMINPLGGEVVIVPPHIECGVGAILAQVEEWAWQERMIVASKVPFFDHHDVAALERAHDALLEIGWSVGLNYGGPGASPGNGSVQDPSQAPFRPAPEHDIPTLVDSVQGREDPVGWWAAWTSLAAAAAKSNFFASPLPTTNNQAGIAGCLANLCALRAAIIEKGPNDTLYGLQWAIESLDSDETELVTTYRAPGWKRVRDAGVLITTLGGWNPAAAKVGTAVTVIGFVGGILDSDIQVEQRVNGIREVVTTLNQRIDELNDTLDGMEDDYLTLAGTTRETIYGIHSFNLELYDLTENSSTLGPSGESVQPGDSPPTERIQIDGVLRIAEACYNLGDAYHDLLPLVAETADAVSSFADKNGTATDADLKAIEIRELFEGFLKTTCARYLLAGDHVHDTVRDYVEVDESQRQSFVDIMDEWEEEGVGEHEFEFHVDDHVAATERPDGAGDVDSVYRTERAER